MTKRIWALSLAIHGLVLAGLIALVQPEARRAEPLRWEVSLQTLAPTRSMPVPPASGTAVAASPPRVTASSPEPTYPVLSAPQPQSAEPVAEPISTPAALHASAPQVTAASTPVPMQAPVPAESTPPDPPPARVDVEAPRRWYAALAAKLAELKRYPLLARRLGQEGLVMLEVTIHPDGRAEAVIKQGSGHAALDRAALNLFQEAVQALPEKLFPAQLNRLNVPLAYRLND
jgi:protein TonB